MIYERRKSERARTEIEKRLKRSLDRDPTAKERIYMGLADIALRDTAPASAFQFSRPGKRSLAQSRRNSRKKRNTN